MKARWLLLLACTALAWCAAPAAAQSGSFGKSLPSEKLGASSYGVGATGGQFGSRSQGAPSGVLASPLNTGGAGPGGTFGPEHFNWDISKINLAAARLKSLNTFALAERTRFARLQEATLNLTALVGPQTSPRPKDSGPSFYQFIFPFGLRDKPADYGYYCPAALQQNLIRNPKEFLAEFTDEMQQTLADDKFLKAVAAMVRDGKLPEGRRLEEFDDSQLAAMGNYLFNSRKYAAAAQVWQALAKLDASSSLFAQAAGQALFAARQLPEAAAQLRRSLTAAKGWGTPAFRLAGVNLQNLYANPDDLAQARAALDAALAADPKNPQLSFLLAYVDLFHGLWERAQTRLTALAAAGEDTAAKLLDLLKTNRLAATIQRPLPDDAGRSPADLARQAAQVQLTPAERQALVDAVLEPKTFEDYMARGDYNFFMGSYARASDAYQTAATMKPDSAAARFAQGHAAFANGEYAFAALTLRQALALEPNWGLANFRLADFFGNRQDLDDRLRDLEHLNALRHDDSAAQFLMAYVYYFDGRYEEAARLFSRLVAASPDYKVADPLLKLARLQS